MTPNIDITQTAPGNELNKPELLNNFKMAPVAELPDTYRMPGPRSGSGLDMPATAMHPMGFMPPVYDGQLGLSGLGSDGKPDDALHGFVRQFPVTPVMMGGPMVTRPDHVSLVEPERIRRQQILMQPKMIQQAVSGAGGTSGTYSIHDIDQFDFDHDIRGSLSCDTTMVRNVSSGGIDSLSSLCSVQHDSLSPAVTSQTMADITPPPSSTANGRSLLDSPGSSSPSLASSQFFPSSFDQQPLLQYCARLRMELDIANKRIETVEDEKRKLIEEKDKAAEQLSRFNGDDSCNFSESRYLRSLHPLSSLDELSVPLLQHIETQLKADLQRVKTMVIQKAAGKCLSCLDRNASIRLPICHHKVLCEVCYMKTNECPSCQASVTIPTQ
jgi:hypothetical protein